METRFYKTFIRVRDMERSKAFYAKLGFEPAPGDPRPTRGFFWIDPERTQLLVLAQETPDHHPVSPLPIIRRA